ncbi:hypothetical protein [Enterocloster asparagiformis]|uniref:Uncharacterized protein n=2 Tax=Enterocloster asparagiformis TaxID=333367 RepID=C0D7B3_9FIRM|nr:hypothetical protein [Enterocloster asparagiformis]EEG52779.1 hypothetical protein CLOSTASPAR_05160 [[Clostridium] asparagiforme DSM 15981]RGX26343.1 hypothetical protein DWV29_19765 [Enterocloster asparagiformis]UWO77824.1 hypothetical protein NQ535_05905 [[Clostridium] asparagiforme DSM 15981]
MGIQESAYDLSVRIAEAVRYLKEEVGEFPLSDKLLDCGVRAGISAREGGFKSAADYVRQADYILEMAAKSGYLSERQSQPIRAECAALLAALEEAERLQQQETGMG